MCEILGNTHDHYMRMYDITCCIAVGRVSTLKQQVQEVPDETMEVTSDDKA